MNAVVTYYIASCSGLMKKNASYARYDTKYWYVLTAINIKFRIDTEYCNTFVCVLVFVITIQLISIVNIPIADRGFRYIGPRASKSILVLILNDCNTGNQVQTLQIVIVYLFTCELFYLCDVIYDIT